MKQFTVKQIGTMEMGKDGMYVKLLPEYIPALKSLEGFGHADILWWFDGCDDEENRSSNEITAVAHRHNIKRGCRNSCCCFPECRFFLCVGARGWFCLQKIAYHQQDSEHNQGTGIEGREGTCTGIRFNGSCWKISGINHHRASNHTK